MLFVSMSLVWEVRVEGNVNVNSEDIKRTLATCGFFEGGFKNKNKLEKIYNSYLIAEPRISWLSINFDGTVAHVEVNETKQIPQKLNRDKNINIVAKSDGVIKRIDVLDGKREAEAGETVTKGQLLISSFVDTRKTGIVMKAARGNVWASTIHNYVICISKKQDKVEYNYTDRNFYIKILGKELPLQFDFLNDKNISKTDMETRRFSVLNSYDFPFTLTTETKNYYSWNMLNISENEAQEKANNELEIRITNDLENAEIIKQNCKKSETEDAYIFEYELFCIENIALETEFDFK